MFCDAEEIKYLKQVTKLIGKEIPLITDHPYHADISQASGKTSSSSSPKPKKKFYPKRR
jgi:ATP-dependent RNA helicase RhlE